MPKFILRIVVSFLVVALVMDPVFSMGPAMPTFAPNTSFLSANHPNYFEDEALTLAVVSFHQALHSKATIMVDREATVIVPIPLRSFTNQQSEIRVTGWTLKQALDNLIDRYPDLKEYLLKDNALPSWLHVVVNATNRSSLPFVRGLWDVLPIPPNAFIYLLPSISGGTLISNEGRIFRAWAEKHRGQQVEGSLSILAKQFHFSKGGAQRVLRDYGITTIPGPPQNPIKSQEEVIRTFAARPALWITPAKKILDLNYLIRKTIISLADEAQKNNVRLHADLPKIGLWIENDLDEKPLGVSPLHLAFESLFFRALTASIAGELWISLEREGLEAISVIRNSGMDYRMRSSRSYLNSKNGTSSRAMDLSAVKHIFHYYGGSMRVETAGVREGFVYTVQFPIKKIYSLMLPLAVGVYLFASHHLPSFGPIFALLHPLILAKGLALAATLPSSRYEKQKLTALRAAAKKIHAQDYTITDIAQEADVRIQRIWELLHGDGTLSETAAKIKEGLNRLKRSIGRKELYSLRVALERKVYSGHSVRSIARQTGVSPRKIQSILDGTTGVSREIRNKLMGAA